MVHNENAKLTSVSKLSAGGAVVNVHSIGDKRSVVPKRPMCHMMFLCNKLTVLYDQENPHFAHNA